MKNSIFCICFLGLIWTSCSKQDMKPTILEGETSENKDTASASASIVNTPDGVPVSPNSVAVNPTTTSVSPTTPISTGPLNPAHGKPGHRCDIAVGAPLSSPPNKTPQQAKITNIQTVPAKNTPIQVAPQNSNLAKTAPGINPPHGQPGHRCDIAVGSPLNSPPATTATSKTTTNSNPTNNIPPLIAAPKE